MSVNDIRFLLFVLISVIIYYVIPRRYRWMVLLTASSVFYISNGINATAYMVMTVILTYAASLILDRLANTKPSGETPEEKKQHKSQLKRQKRIVLSVALLLNFLSLGVFKYSGFFVANINGIVGYDILPIPSFLLPLGISFYIFQTAGYMIDVMRGKYAAEHNFAKYALFTCYFPQLVQGPINRYDLIGESLYVGNELDFTNIQAGILRMMLGILKKAMIADVLAPAVAKIYSGYGNYPGVISFIGAALYCVQLYCDFSGGVDLLCGTSRLFGVKMMENFKQPYFALSLADFWRRWHISLGEWMKDYLFYPLAFSSAMTKLTKKARGFLPADIVKRITPCLCTFIVFLAVGIWQGPGWANIAYGLWNGFWMSLGLMWVPFGAKLKDKLPQNKIFLTVWGVIRTNFLVIIGRYFSNAYGGSFSNAVGMLKHTILSPGFSAVNAEMLSGLGLGFGVIARLIPALAILFSISLAKEKDVDLLEWFCKRPWYVQFVLLFFGLALIVMGVYGNDSYTPIAYVYENI